MESINIIITLKLDLCIRGLHESPLKGCVGMLPCAFTHIWKSLSSQSALIRSASLSWGLARSCDDVFLHEPHLITSLQVYPLYFSNMWRPHSYLSFSSAGSTGDGVCKASWMVKSACELDDRQTGVYASSPGADKGHKRGGKWLSCSKMNGGGGKLGIEGARTVGGLYCQRMFGVAAEAEQDGKVDPSASSSTNIETNAGVKKKWVPKDRQRVVPVYAYFVGRKIDLVGVSNDPQVRKFRRGSGRDHVIIEFQGQGNQGRSAHLVVYKYGSIVLFNAPIPKEKHEELMTVCQRYTSEPIAQPSHEVQSVVVVPHMTNWYRQEGDRIKVKELDIDNMRVISSVLGQSVALDQYSRQIDRALQEFNSINREMERTGSFTITRQELFRLVARNNTMITEAIIVLGLLDRSDTAWTNDKYYGVWSMMESEYELTQRFEAMDKKLTLIQESAKYFLQILQDNKSVFLEWFIIILIMAELVVGVYDLSTRS